MRREGKQTEKYAGMQIEEGTAVRTVINAHNFRGETVARISRHQHKIRGRYRIHTALIGHEVRGLIWAQSLRKRIEAGSVGTIF